MFERFAQPARVAVEDARFEASRRGDRRIGTEHLLLALLHDDALAAVVGVDAEAAREASDELDRRALVAVGLDIGDYRPAGRTALGTRTPLTAGAKEVLSQALADAAGEKARTITTRHLMLALLKRPDADPVAGVLAELGVDRGAARERLSAG